MSTAAIAFRVPIDVKTECEKIASMQGIALTELGKSIFTSIAKGEKEVITVEPDGNAALARLEAQNDLLKEQLRELQTQLSSVQKEQGLSGFENKQLSVKKQIDTEVQKFKDEMMLEGLRTKIKDLESDLAEVEDELKTAKEFIAKEDGKARTIETVGKVTTMIGAINPHFANKMLNGLGGLLGLDAADEVGSLAPSLSDDDKKALEAGKMVMQAFPQDLMPIVVEVLTYYSQNNKALIALYNKLQQSPKQN